MSPWMGGKLTKLQMVRRFSVERVPLRALHACSCVSHYTDPQRGLALAEVAREERKRKEDLWYVSACRWCRLDDPRP
jgi:hypothetical protein